MGPCDWLGCCLPELALQDAIAKPLARSDALFSECRALLIMLQYHRRGICALNRGQRLVA
jgi:hypothetical protein